MGLPKTTSEYRINFSKGFDGLQLHHDVPLPELQPHDCLVRLEAVSLNYRDIALPLGVYPGGGKDDIVPCSDGAGTVLAIGSAVTQFQPGDKVCNTFFLEYESGTITAEARLSSLGSVNDGVLRKHVVFSERALVKLGKGMGSREASTLPCAALTAWHSLMGIEGLRLQAGQCILTQGTGGVSLSAIQIALAKGAIVIATTSSYAKAERLRKMGVQHVINYRTDPNWGETARRLSPGGRGVEHVIEVGGEATMAQSFKAVALGGCVDIIGFLGNKSKNEQGGSADSDATGPTKVGFWDTFRQACVVRGITVGSREQFREMVTFMEEKNIVPIIDDARRFGFEDARAAYEYLKSQTGFGKVVIDVSTS